MTKEQILQIVGLTPEQKQRVEAAFTAAERTKGTCVLASCTTEAEVKTAIAKLMDNYAKRCAAKEKKASKKAETTAEVDALTAILTEAKKYGFTATDVVNAVKNLIKEKKNAEIQAKIAELQAQMIQ